jgi:cytochrome c
MLGMRNLVIALTMLGPLPFAVAQSAPDLEKRGERLVSRYCGPCHGVGRSDASAHAQAPLFRSLGRRYPIRSLEEALGEGILSGHPDMPEFRFEPEEVGAVIAYLESIQER